MARRRSVDGEALGWSSGLLVAQREMGVALDQVRDGSRAQVDRRGCDDTLHLVEVASPISSLIASLIRSPSFPKRLPVRPFSSLTSKQIVLQSRVMRRPLVVRFGRRSVVGRPTVRWSFSRRSSGRRRPVVKAGWVMGRACVPRCVGVHVLVSGVLMVVALVFDPLVPTSDRQHPSPREWRNDLAEPPGFPSSNLLHRPARLVNVPKACLGTSKHVAGRWRIFGSGSRRFCGLQLDRWRLDCCRSRCRFQRWILPGWRGGTGSDERSGSGCDIDWGRMGQSRDIRLMRGLVRGREWREGLRLLDDRRRGGWSLSAL